MIVGSLGRVVNEGFELKNFGQKVADVAKAPLVPGGAIIGAGAGLLSGVGVGLGAGAAGGAAIGNRHLYAPGAVLGGIGGGALGGVIGGAVGLGVGGAAGWSGTKKILYGDVSSKKPIKFTKKQTDRIGQKVNKYKNYLKKLV